MKVPYQLNFTGHDKEVSKVQKLVCSFKVSTSSLEQSSKLTEINGSAENIANPDGPTVITDDILPAAKRKLIFDNSSKQHQISSAIMTNEDLEEIII